MNMQPLVVTGIFLTICGIIALAIPSLTFFTTERIADVGFFSIDISKPHTIVFNPIVGAIALTAGILLVLFGWRSVSA